MAELLWAVLCYKANVDKETNNVSLLDVLEQITLQPGQDLEDEAEGIAMAHHMELATLWRRTDPAVPELGHMRLELVTPRNNVSGRAELPLRLDTSVRYRGIVKLDALPFEGFGTYRFRVSKKEEGDWREVTSVPLEVGKEKEKPVEPQKRSSRTGRNPKR